MKNEAPIGPDRLRRARQDLNRYREGKANLERRVIENEQWYRLRHWECIRRGAGSQVEPTSGWLFNAIANKHAEAMDNYPSPNVLPREEGDREKAQALGSILPVILQQEDFEDTYDRVMDDKLKSGTGIYGIFWDPEKLEGLGDISIRRIDVLNLYWEGGITDIQQSRNVFYLRLWDNDLLLERYPQLEGKLSGAAEQGNRTLGILVDQCMRDLGAPAWTDADFALADRFLHTYPRTTMVGIREKLGEYFDEDELDKALQKPLDQVIHPFNPKETGYHSGSTDVGDVGYATPTVSFNIATACLGNVGHSWQNTAFACSDIGFKGMLRAAEVLTLAAVRTMDQPEVIAKAKEELKKKNGGKYQCPLPEYCTPPIGRY